MIQRSIDTIRVDAFASVTARLALQNPVPLARACATDPGTVVIVRALLVLVNT